MTVNIDVVYCANYNGCTVEVNGVSDDECANAATVVMCDLCDDDGYCEEDDGVIADRLIAIVSAKYGNNAVVNVRVDRMSS